MREGAQPTLTGRVRLAKRARLHARLGEALLLSVAGTLFLLCLALTGDCLGLEFDALASAAFGGSLMGVLWIAETRQKDFDWARNVDRSLGLNGRLLAALNVEKSANPSAMGELLIDGLRPRVSRKAILQRAVPVSLWLLVLPFVGGSLLMQGLRSQRSEVLRWERSAPQFRELQDRLGEAQQRAQTLQGEPELLQELQVMQDAARRGGLEMELGKGDAQEWSSELKELAQNLAQVGQELRGDSQWDRTMDQAQALVAALEDRIGEPIPGPGAPGAGEPNRPNPRNQPQGKPQTQLGLAQVESQAGKGAEDASGASFEAGGNAQGGPGSSQEPSADPPTRVTGPVNLGEEGLRLESIPQVARPYRGLVRKILAAGQ